MYGFVVDKIVDVLGGEIIDGDAATCLFEGGASDEMLMLSVGLSIICAVELKDLERSGRRNVGGSILALGRMSRMDLRIVFVNIVALSELFLYNSNINVAARAPVNLSLSHV